MNRLLMAAARGARLDWYDTFKGVWYPNVVNVPVQAKFKSMDRYYRIHPDDAHLEYGPVSTALREAATTDYQPNEYVMAALSIANYIHPQWSYRWETELHRSLFLLILAEALCDEGL